MVRWQDFYWIVPCTVRHTFNNIILETYSHFDVDDDVYFWRRRQYKTRFSCPITMSQEWFILEQGKAACDSLVSLITAVSLYGTWRSNFLVKPSFQQFFFLAGSFFGFEQFFWFWRLRLILERLDSGCYSKNNIK